MSIRHSGNMLNEITFEEHDGLLNAKKVSLVSAATIYAVVNTGLAGNVTLDPGSRTGIVGNVTLSDSKGYIGLVSVSGTVVANAGTDLNTSLLFKTTDFNAVVTTNRVQVDASTTNVAQSGSWTVVADAGTNLNTSALALESGGNLASLNAKIGSNGLIGIVTVANKDRTITGNLTLSDPKGFIGLVTVVQSSTARSIVGNITLSDPKTYIGLTTTTLGLGDRYIGLVTSTQNGLVTLAPSPNFIGIVTVTNKDRTITGNLTLSDSKGFIGLVTVGGISTITLADPKGFIGLVTAITKNGGTTKTLIPKTLILTTASIATIVVPTNTFYVTNILLNSDATVRVSIKSGVTYLTGNASVGITLNPGGGWVETGSPDSPTYQGLAAAAAIVLEKLDLTATSAKVGGKLLYFDE